MLVRTGSLAKDLAANISPASACPVVLHRSVGCWASQHEGFCSSADGAGQHRQPSGGVHWCCAGAAWLPLLLLPLQTAYGVQYSPRGVGGT